LGNKKRQVYCILFYKRIPLTKEIFSADNPLFFLPPISQKAIVNKLTTHTRHCLLLPALCKHCKEYSKLFFYIQYFLQ